MRHTVETYTLVSQCCWFKGLYINNKEYVPWQSAKGNLFLVYSLIDLCEVLEGMLKYLSANSLPPSISPSFPPSPPLSPSFPPPPHLPSPSSLRRQYTMRNTLLDMTGKAVV